MNKKLIILIITTIILIFGIVTLNFVKTIREKQVSQTVDMNEKTEEISEEIVNDITEEEISIEELEQENTVNETKNTVANETTNKVSDKSSSSTNKNIDSTKKYYIKVNYKANVVTIYTKDENGEYTVPYRAMICSTGTATPKSGVYKIQSRWRWLHLFGDVYGQYSTQIVGNILFHSVPYLKKTQDSLEYWEYDKLGTSCSMGCIRLTVRDAKWIYNNIPRGTAVEFYASSNPGPLGKPSAQKISGNKKCRNWDPTDDHKDNPWNSYNKKEENKKDENSNKNTIKNNTINNTVNNTINAVNNILINNTINNTIDNVITNNTINNTDDNVIINNIISNIINNVTNNEN